MATSQQVAVKILGFEGRMLSPSKSEYHHKYPKHVVIFNARICVPEPDLGVIWRGDLDLFLDIAKLQVLAKCLHTDIYIIHESDASFDNEALPLYDKHVLKISPTKSTIGKQYKAFARKQHKTGGLYLKPTPRRTTPKAPTYSEFFNKLDFKALGGHTIPKHFKVQKGVETSPLFQFYQGIASFLNIDYKDTPLTRLYVTTELCARIERAEKQWVKNNVRTIPTYKMTSSFAFHMLQYSPCEFYNAKAPWINSDTVYLRKETKQKASAKK